MRSENTMTVAELIEALKGFPSAAEVYIYVPDPNKGMLGGFSYLNCIERGAGDTVVLSNYGVIYLDDSFDDREESGLFEED